MNHLKALYNMTLGRIDPRYYVLTNHIILLSTAILLFDLRRTGDQISFALAVGIITELILARWTLKQGSFNTKDRILSSTVLILSTLLLVRSYYWWFYGFIAFVGVLSKYVLVNDKGRHIFNPTNVAIVFAIIILPDFLSVRADSFSTHIFSLSCILFFGILVTIRANCWRITLGYFVGICLIGYPASLISGYPFLLIYGPELNVGIFLFAFMMITDPQTAPKGLTAQWSFGLLIAAVNLFLRYEQLYYAPFIALFIVLAFSRLIFGPESLLKKENFKQLFSKSPIV